ncbi:MAG: DUF1836 domain-containing protein [Eubacteriaceae bacterium]|nr:DUF1836 domain-containing protein [Eubacteriaceae bacterium]
MSEEKKLWEFTMPRYNEITNVGLYLKQVVKLISEVVEPYFGLKVSDTMLSNYVKMHIVPGPVKKMYYRDQIASLLFVVLSKTVLSLDNIQILLKMQEKSYSPDVAYDYFCSEFENALQYVCGKKDSMGEIDADASNEKKLLRNIIIAMAHKFALDDCFAKLSSEEELL